MTKPEFTQRHKVYIVRAIMLALIVLGGIVARRYLQEDGKKEFEQDIALLRQALFMDPIKSGGNGGGAA